MTYDEAARIASNIRDYYHRLDVLAIGRFIPPAELETTPERWGISVWIDRTKQTVLWETQSHLAYANYDRKRTTTKKKTKKTPAEDNPAPMLF